MASEETDRLKKEQAEERERKREEHVRAMVVAPTGGVQIQKLEDLVAYANYVAKSELTPQSLDTAEKVMVAMQTGMEAGLTPMQALRSVYVVGGSPAWKGDAALALVQNSKLLERIETGFFNRASGEMRSSEWDESDDYTAFVVATRRDTGKTERREFSVRQAKIAQLWMKETRSGKPSPWKLHPTRMLYYRALGFCLRDLFPDVLMGLHVAEELDEYGEPPKSRATDRPPEADLVPDSDDPLAAELGLEPGTEVIDVHADVIDIVPEAPAAAEPAEEEEPPAPPARKVRVIPKEEQQRVHDGASYQPGHNAVLPASIPDEEEPPLLGAGAAGPPPPASAAEPEGPAPASANAPEDELAELPGDQEEIEELELLPLAAGVEGDDPGPCLKPVKGAPQPNECVEDKGHEGPCIPASQMEK